ncbi:hypothetical protein ZIOFF_009681 [Zingiber officinale]|uniref:Uncharacterized protein n=1 Tax=Zingiber officinale TaxID=94328 RepID=A0A8J5LNW6_ZINOF|nr:hypothetical protein ZIOFF_009681 [Zingiber officinale]
METISPPIMKQSYPYVSLLKQFYEGRSFVVSFNGSFLICSYGDEVKLVSSSDSSTLRSILESSTSFTLSLDDRLLFTTTDNHKIQVWEVSSRKCIHSWK